MDVRDINENDLSQLAELYRRFWNEESDIKAMKEQFRNVSGKDTHILLCAAEDEKLLGSVMGVICEELYGDCRPFLVIENMIVHENARRRGIAASLLRELETRAKERNCTQMILVTELDRNDACGFYESNGFRRGVSAGYKKKL